MMQDNRKHFPLLFYIITPLLSCLLALALLELFLAVFYPVPFSVEPGVFFEPDPFTGHRPQRNSTGYFRNNIAITINSHGQRDDEISLARKDDSIRILVIGDSFTFGNNVRQEETYPQVMEEIMNRHLTKKVEVINAGVGAWEPFQYFQYYNHYGRFFNPDFIVIGFFVGNDTYKQLSRADQLDTVIMGKLVRKEAAHGAFIRLKVFLYNKTNIGRLLLREREVVLRSKGKCAGRLKDYAARTITSLLQTRSNPQNSTSQSAFRRKRCNDFTKFFLAIQRRRLRNHLKRDRHRYALAENSVYQIYRIKQAADRAAIPLAVVLIPDENQINPALQQRISVGIDMQNYDFTMPQSMLKEMFQDRDIPTIDLLPAFLQDSRCLYMNDTHWSSEGHRLAASIIARKLIPFFQ